MESVVLLLLLSSVIIGVLLRRRIGRRRAGILTVLSAAGIVLGFGLFYLLLSTQVPLLHPYRAALVAGFLLVISLCLLPIGLLGLSATPRTRLDSHDDSA